MAANARAQPPVVCRQNWHKACPALPADGKPPGHVHIGVGTRQRIRPATALAVLAVLLWIGPATADPADLPAGTYVIDPSHASLVFTVDHLGFSNYTAGFDRFAATLLIDPADPGSARLTAEIDVFSLDVPHPPEGFLQTLFSEAWFDVAVHPAISFESETINLTSDQTADVDGRLTLLGVTRPVTLSVRFNGGYAGHPMDPNARIGFSATGQLARSDFGFTIGIPPAGSTMGVGDTVGFRIEAEFTGPPLPQ